MDKHWILVPMLAQVALSAVVWLWMYYTRLREIFRQRIPVQDLADTRYAEKRLARVAGPSENLVNLFEVPVLFYTAVLTLFVTGFSDRLYLYLAGIYVALRAVHSLIHVTYNRVVHRFGIYVLSTVVLWALWVRLALDVLGALKG